MLRSPASNVSNVVVPAMLSTADAAAYLGVSIDTLARWRMAGVGPKYVKSGRFIRYPAHYLTEWFKENLRDGGSLEEQRLKERE